MREEEFVAFISGSRWCALDRIGNWRLARARYQENRKNVHKPPVRRIPLVLLVEFYTLWISKNTMDCHDESLLRVVKWESLTPDVCSGRTGPATMIFLKMIAKNMIIRLECMISIRCTYANVQFKSFHVNTKELKCLTHDFLPKFSNCACCNIFAKPHLQLH